MRRSSHRGYRSRTPLPDGFRVLLRRLCRLFFRVIARVQMVGQEHIPASGPCILAFNHLSMFDPPLIAAIVKRADLTGMIASSYRARLLSRLAVDAGGGIWVRRGTADLSALRAALATLEEGSVLALSPEGGRSTTGALRSAHIGVAWLAERSGAPIVPIALTNTRALSQDRPAVPTADLSGRAAGPRRGRSARAWRRPRHATHRRAAARGVPRRVRHGPGPPASWNAGGGAVIGSGTRSGSSEARVSATRDTTPGAS